MFITNITNNIFKSTTFKKFLKMSRDVESETSSKNFLNFMKFISYNFFHLKFITKNIIYKLKLQNFFCGEKDGWSDRRGVPGSF